MWVSVDDRLPVRGERVIATDGSFVGEAYLSASGKWVRYGNALSWVDTLGKEVVKWMPMPEV